MKNKISLQDIPANIKYDGYLWWSNQEKPDVYMDQNLKSQDHKPIWPTESSNPFIIEGNLWNKVDEISYLIRFIDGEYLVYEFKLKGSNPENITKLEYLPNRMPPDIKKLLFKEVWIEQSDPLCEGFEVLKPAFIAFVGFKK
ncbi:MAG: TIGR04423 family type III CRISPR-associated protein [Bacteroidetes bacterium]|nr:TIGR04423 family type III CRISPR-associated protein [Bacteroidota bacterium]MCL6102438.1 TIGR04423 family type III CRISPR-associated protein [Bacteroidota bacterium]